VLECFLWHWPHVLRSFRFQTQDPGRFG
jgi:hypothetical protein